MLESGDSVDKEMYQQAQEIYGEHLIKNVVLKMHVLNDMMAQVLLLS